jgi:hypothetical protein
LAAAFLGDFTGEAFFFFAGVTGEAFFFFAGDLITSSLDDFAGEAFFFLAGDLITSSLDDFTGEAFVFFAGDLITSALGDFTGEAFELLAFLELGDPGDTAPALPSDGDFGDTAGLSSEGFAGSACV